jgi:hypothetical protein
LAKYAEAGVLYFNNPGNRPAGYTSQVLDPGSVTSLQTVSYINNRSGLKVDPRLVGLIIHVDPKGLQRVMQGPELLLPPV